jgi:methyl-accepting chemotaxis protein
MPLIKRKRYFVERQLQMRFARFVLMFMLAGCVVTGLAVFYATFMVLSDKLVGVYPQSRLVEIFGSLYGALFMALLLAVPVIVYAAIVLSHRVAGPLPKIYQALKEIGNGNFEVYITLRKKDELKELAQTINEMAASLRARELKK